MEVFEKLEKKKEGRGNSYNCMFTSFLTRVCMMVTATRRDQQLDKRDEREKSPQLEAGKSYCPITVLIRGTAC